MKEKKEPKTEDLLKNYPTLKKFDEYKLSFPDRNFLKYPVLKLSINSFAILLEVSESKYILLVTYIIIIESIRDITWSIDKTMLIHSHLVFNSGFTFLQHSHPIIYKFIKIKDLMITLLNIIK